MARSRKNRSEDDEAIALPTEELAGNVEFAAPSAPLLEPGESVHFGTQIVGSAIHAARRKYFGGTTTAMPGPAPIGQKRKSPMKKTARQIVEELMPHMEVVETVRNAADAQPLPPDAV